METTQNCNFKTVQTWRGQWRQKQFLKNSLSFGNWVLQRLRTSFPILKCVLWYRWPPKLYHGFSVPYSQYRHCRLHLQNVTVKGNPPPPPTTISPFILYWDTHTDPWADPGGFSLMGGGGGGRGTANLHSLHSEDRYHHCTCASFTSSTRKRTNILFRSSVIHFLWSRGALIRGNPDSHSSDIKLLRLDLIPWEQDIENELQRILNKLNIQV